MPQIDSDTRDKCSPVWDMSQERLLLENQSNQRFNFYLVFFSLVLAASANAKTVLHLRTIVTLGCLVGMLMTLAIFGAQIKHELCVAELFTDPTHPMAILDERARTKWHPYARVRLIVWRLLPMIFTAALTAGALVAWFAPSLWLAASVPAAGSHAASTRVDSMAVRLEQLEARLDAASLPKP